MALRVAFVALSLSIALSAVIAQAGGPPVCAPQPCVQQMPSCPPITTCQPPPCDWEPGLSGLMGGGPLTMCTNICGAIIGIPGAIMNGLLAPGPRRRSCVPPSIMCQPACVPCAPVPACAPPQWVPVCSPPVCAPQPIAKCKGNVCSPGPNFGPMPQQMTGPISWSAYR